MQQIEFIFSSFFALHVSGATFTHPQETQLYKQVWCNCISRCFVARRSVCQIQNSCMEGVSWGCRLYTCQSWTCNSKTDIYIDT
jgi:hypothetical protein